MNSTLNIDDREEFERVFDTITEEEFEEARISLEKQPRKFYAQLVALLWNCEDWESCGTDVADNDIVRDIYDTIQGIAARDTILRQFNKLAEEIAKKHPDWHKIEVLNAAKCEYHKSTNKEQ